jgi:hypothetical protein
MADAFTYQKKRKEFGRHAQFEDTDTKIVGSIPPNPNAADKFIQRNPNKIILSNIPKYTEHTVSFGGYNIFFRSTLKEFLPATRE